MNNFEERFDEIFSEMDKYELGYIPMEEIKSFIANEKQLSRKQAFEDVLREVEQLIDSNDDGMWSGRETADEIINIIQKLKDNPPLLKGDEKMNREIKFRAWDGEKMIMIDGLWGNQSNYKYQDVMQYTGLKDKNGKEIYEGDVVKAVGGAGERGFVWEVYWSNSVNFSGWKLKGTGRTGKTNYYEHWCGKDMEIIGNIYENPELLT